MPAEDPVTAAVTRPASHIQDFIFIRELCEVYLLLDHISGRWDKSFPEKNPGAFSANETVTIEDICKIGWPVVGNTLEQAQQATKLLMAKDMLNAAAKPANGATVAFTLMVVGEGNRQLGAPGTTSKSPAEPGHGGESRKAEAQRRESDAYWLGDHKTPPDRYYLAQRAYPGLVDAAAVFRKRISILVYSLLGFLLLTCALSWYAATGNIILTHLDATHLQQREIGRKIGAAVTSSLAAHVQQQSGPLRMAASNLDILPKGDPANSPAACRAYFGNVVDHAKSAEPSQICDILEDKIKEHEAIGASLSGWLFWKNASAAFESHSNNEEFSRVLTQVLASSVLPFFYGILGAGAAIVRDLWSKTRESCLSPRDSTLAMGQLALGAIIGGCISLFIGPPAVGAPSGDSVLGSFVLTGSALSFVAGFGVEGVFQSLESLVRRIFNNPDPTKSK